MKLLIKILKKDFAIFFNISNISLIILSFIVIIVSSISEINAFIVSGKTYISLEDAMFLAFRGPGNEYTFFQLLKWLLPILIVLFIFGRMTNVELNNGYIYAIYRFGNKQSWLKGKFVFIFLFSFFYYICLYGISLIVFFFKFHLDGSFSYYLISSAEMNISIIKYVSPLILLLIMLILNIISCFGILILQILISIITKKAYYGFLFSIILALISLTSNKLYYKLDVFFPLNYGIANRFNTVTSSGYICYLYICSIFLLLMYIGTLYVKRNEIFE
ncbi:hypothetical protein KPL37_01155 [Clostridium frigoris]|uniref:ABC-2 family transporter protein n=1 Tax=Clostridium frigoris TaxID=205327 RepID=A0ABS6BQU9_9CLOT|nr:hypothetical protein [Clostridium frigoris]MBU3158379.1 hypothetical protein [Clostridium frigoris]